MIRTTKSRIVRKNTIVKPAGKRRIQRIQTPISPTTQIIRSHPKVRKSISRKVEVRRDIRGAKGGGFDWSKVKFSKIEPIWKGETVFIIGGGPSLKELDFNRLKSKRTIAINKAFFSHPTADMLYWTDSRVYSWYKTDIDKFKGHKYTTKPYGNVTQSVKVLKNTGKSGLEFDPSGIRHGNNSGHAAINIAYHTGAKRIVLLGFDMKNTAGGVSHFHDGYPIKSTRNDTYAKSMIPEFFFIADALEKKGVKVINACPNSELKIFPRMSIDQALTFS